MAYFANYFKMRDLSDITMVIRLSPSEDQEQLQVSEDSAGPPLKRTRRKTDDAADANPRQLSSFPAHRLVLFSSDYFKAQGRHWQAQPNAAQNCKKGTAGEPTGSSSEATEHPCVHLTIDSAEQLPAAEAVIATMYGVPGATGTLEQQQLVHAVVLADMVGVEAASEQALQALTSAALSQQGLPAAALDALAGLAAWPACLLQLLPMIMKHAPCCQIDAATVEPIAAADTNGSVQRLLLAVFGNLDAVCADRQMKQLLLGLPLPALQLLLSSDQLRVATEDTVLYVAQSHLTSCYNKNCMAAVRLSRVQQLLNARAALAGVVRAPQLSLFSLSCAALSPSRSWNHSPGVLDPCVAQLRSLLSLRQAASQEQLPAAIAAFTTTSPASWRLGARQIRPLADGVRLEWRLPVEQLKQACRDSCAQQKAVYIYSPDSSPPMGGLAWLLHISCVQQGGGSIVGLFVGPRQRSEAIWYKCKFTVTWDPCELQQQGDAHRWRQGVCELLWPGTYGSRWLGLSSMGCCGAAYVRRDAAAAACAQRGVRLLAGIYCKAVGEEARLWWLAKPSAVSSSSSSYYPFKP